MRIGVNFHRVEFGRLGAGERIEFRNIVYQIAEQLDAPGAVLVVRGEKIDGVAAHAEAAARKAVVVAAVLQGDELGEKFRAGDFVAARNGEGHAGIGFNRADAVDARHARHDDDVVAFEDGAGGGVAHAVDFLVHRRIFFDVGVGARDIGFGLVVIVIRDEIFHRVFGEEVFHLAVKLRRQRLVGRQDERRALHGFDHLRHGEGLAGTRDAQQHLIAFIGIGASDEFLDRGRLITGRLVF